MPKRVLVPLLIVPLHALAACGGGGGDGSGGPMTPPPAPTIASVSPAEARAGEGITINGSGFGSDAAAARVTVRGQQAEVVSIADATISATVPAIAAGDAPVVVTVSGRASNEAAFEVLPSPPVITAVEPDPVRAGEPVVIRGRNFTDAPTGLRTAQTPLQVLIDARTVEVTEVAFDRIVANLPLDLALGPRSLTVVVGELRSEPVAFEVQTFDLDGLWWPSTSDAVASNDCGFGATAGSRFPYGFTLDDPGGGTLGGFYNGIDLSGTVDLATGAIDIEGSADGMTLGITGTSRVTAGERSLDLEFDFFHFSPGCRIRAPVDATRTIEEPLRYVGGISLFDDVLAPGQSFAQVTGDHDLPIRDAVSGHRVGALPLSISGESFAFRQDGVVQFDFVSGALRWGLDQADLVGIADPVPGPFCLMAPFNGQTVTGSLLDGSGSTLFSADFAPGQDLRMQLPFEPGTAEARYTGAGDGVGFSRFVAIYSGVWAGPLPSGVDPGDMGLFCDLGGEGYGGY